MDRGSHYNVLQHLKKTPNCLAMHDQPVPFISMGKRGKSGSAACIAALRFLGTRSESTDADQGLNVVEGPRRVLVMPGKVHLQTISVPQGFGHADASICNTSFVPKWSVQAHIHENP